MITIISCSSKNKTETKDGSFSTSEVEVIPDNVVQFLIASAAKDFKEHQPPTAVDIRNVKIGYIGSLKEKKVFVLCGEFLSQEDKKWVEFTTMKTFGYEQFLGKTQYCHDATIVLSDENLSLELKNKLLE